MPRSRASKPNEPQPKTKRQSKKSKVDDSLFERDPERLMGSRRRPKHWDLMSFEEKLEYIASRILAEDRQGVTSHKELKETGILSNSQYERRRNREVYSQFGSLDEIRPTQGSFNRVHVRDLRGYKAARDWEQEAKAEKAERAKKKTTTKRAVSKNKPPASKKAATKKAATKKKPVAKKKSTKKNDKGKKKR